jgi:hypothetical protein
VSLCDLLPRYHLRTGTTLSLLRIGVTVLRFVCDLQVDANAFFVDYGKVADNINYLQSVSDIRVAARYVVK